MKVCESVGMSDSLCVRACVRACSQHCLVPEVYISFYEQAEETMADVSSDVITAWISAEQSRVNLSVTEHSVNANTSPS